MTGFGRSPSLTSPLAVEDVVRGDVDDVRVHSPGRPGRAPGRLDVRPPGPLPLHLAPVHVGHGGAVHHRLGPLLPREVLEQVALGDVHLDPLHAAEGLGLVLVVGGHDRVPFPRQELDEG